MVRSKDAQGLTLPLFVEQVLNPKGRYAGQNRNKPVAIGKTPIQPHGPMLPVSVRPISTRPRHDAQHTVDSSHIRFHARSPSMVRRKFSAAQVLSGLSCVICIRGCS
jgi:hypothetical protein